MISILCKLIEFLMCSLKILLEFRALILNDFLKAFDEFCAIHIARRHASENFEIRLSLVRFSFVVTFLIKFAVRAGRTSGGFEYTEKENVWNWNMQRTFLYPINHYLYTLAYL